MFRIARGAILTLWIPVISHAQAWNPGKGELVVSVNYQYLHGGNHLFSDSFVFDTDLGSRSVDLGTVEGQVLLMSAELGVTDRLTLEGAVPFAAARYVGPDPHPGLSGGFGDTRDDGHWNNSFQDARVGARFKLLNRPSWVLTPSISYGFPTSDYPILGHSALGRHLKELQLGLDVGRVLAWSDEANGYFQSSYSYAFMEDIERISLDRSDAFFEVGFFLPRFVTVQVFGHYQNIHGGTDWAADLHPDSHVELLINHDATAATHFWRMGGGISVPLTDRVELFGNVSKTIWGVNTHDAVTVAVGMAWSFQVLGGVRGFGN